MIIIQDKLLRSLVQRQLEKLGYTTTAAATVVEWTPARDSLVIVDLAPGGSEPLPYIKDITARLGEHSLLAGISSGLTTGECEGLIAAGVRVVLPRPPKLSDWEAATNQLSENDWFI